MNSQNVPRVMDSLSAPMLGINQRIVVFNLLMRTSHLRNFDRPNYSMADQFLVMLNPEVHPEQHASASLQYEFDFLEGGKCKEAKLVQRTDFVNVRYQSMHTGQRHHIILPFRESRMMQYHMKLLDGQNPFPEITSEIVKDDQPTKKNSRRKSLREAPEEDEEASEEKGGRPHSLSMHDLHNDEFVEEYGRHLNMMKDVTKMQRF